MKYFIINKYLFFLCFFNISFFYASESQSLVGYYKPISICSDHLKLEDTTAVIIEIAYEVPTIGFDIEQFSIPMTEIASTHKNSFVCKESIELERGKYKILAYCTSLDTENKAIGCCGPAKNDFQSYFSKMVALHPFFYAVKQITKDLK